MPETRIMTLPDIAHALKIGESTLNVWLKRYKKWLPAPVDEERIHYPAVILDQIRFILKCTHAGMEAHEIECALEVRLNTGDTHSKSGPDIMQAAGQLQGADPNLLGAIKDMMAGIVAQQTRIADAQERRAIAEERKAYALESRAENELIKVDMLREIVTALQDMSVKSSVSSLMDRVKDDRDFPFDELETFPSDNISLDTENMDDIPDLILGDEPPLLDEKVRDNELTTDIAFETNSPLQDSFDLYIPDVSSGSTFLDEAMDSDSDSRLQSHSIETVPTDPDPDDQSFLLEPADRPSAERIDDLTKLLEPGDLQTKQDIDDLSGLLEPEDLKAAAHVDDLSALLEPEDRVSSSDVDDLSSLLEPEDRVATHSIDDLSVLLEPEDRQSAKDVDNLSALIDDDKPEPVKSEPMPMRAEKARPPEPGPTPQETKPAQKAGEDHKSKILKRIIQMKQKQGLSIEETTRIFNEEGVKTLSGKPSWDTKTIQGIYKYIDSVSK